MASTNHADLYESFIQLIRLGIGTSQVARISKEIDWPALKALADEQGLSAVILDALNSGGDDLTSTMPVQVKLEWIGEVLQNYEQRYKQYENTISSMACFYNQHGFKMMLLKGYACSLNWPKPEHRPCGDIDIWQFGQWKEADAALSKERGLKIDDSHEHHTVFYWYDFMVENHYDFIDVHHRKSSPQLEAIFKELGKDDSFSIEICGEKVYFPSPNLHALFLLRHAMEHFASTELTLRQLLDWAFFVKRHGKVVNWEWLLGIIEEFGMSPAFNIFNTICVGDLGFDASIFPQVLFNPFLKDRVLADILSPEFVGEEPKSLLPRVAFKYRRWKANGWKNELCFKESMWSAFCSGVWGHLLKPSSI